MAILTGGEVQFLLRAIEQRTGIRHRPDQLESMTKTISRVMREAEIEQIDEFLTALDRDDSVFRNLVDSITVGETYFFREPMHFEFIREQVIPEFRARYGDRTTFRAWSAACSTGEEAYSLAIVCDELGQAADILATDIAAAAIDRSRRACYRDWSFRGDSLRRIRPYLVPGDGENERELNPRLRRAVRFRMLNLVSGSYPDFQSGTSYLNLILCRNVLIYFDPATARRIAGRLVECLAPGGWLVTASVDLSLVDLPGVTAVTNRWGTFYRRDEWCDPIVPPPNPTERSGPWPEPGSELGLRPATPTDSISTDGENANRQSPGRQAPARQSPRRQSPGHPAHGDGKDQLPPPNAPDEPSDRDRIGHIVESIGQMDLESALARIADSVDLYPLEVRLHYHHGRLLMEAGEAAAAAKAVQKALFLEQSAVMPHFLFGTIQISRGQWESAARHLRAARQLCRQFDPEDRIPMSDQMTAAHTIAALDSQLAKLPGLSH